jgi:hypothetical protein
MKNHILYALMGLLLIGAETNCTRVDAGPLKAKGEIIVYKGANKIPIRIEKPIVLINQQEVVLEYQKVKQYGDSVIRSYTFNIDDNGQTLEGVITQHFLLPKSDKEFLLIYSDFKTNSPIHSDAGVRQTYTLVKNAAKSFIVENMELAGSGKEAYGNTKNSAIYTYGLSKKPFIENEAQAAFYEMGFGSTDKKGYRISMPIIGLDLTSQNNKDNFLSVSSDPYCGTQFYTNVNTKKNTTTIETFTNYSGSKVALSEEKHKTVLSFTNSKEQHISSFYNTIPEIKPGPDWIKQIAMAYYDYLGDDGKAWYNDIDMMVKVFPKEYLDKIVVCMHGWYNNIGYYSYNSAKGELIDSWEAFANPSKYFPRNPPKKPVKMSKEEMHKRINYAKSKGFKVILFYADCTNSTGLPDYFSGQEFLYPDGGKHPGWEGPCGGGTTVDITSYIVQDWFKGYMKVLLKEFGDEVDGFVWDESHYFLVGDLSYRDKENPQYADRAMMKTMGELTQIVDAYNPNLVLMEGSHYYYGIVANGSFTDFEGLPVMINYRNASWTCSWANPGIRNVQTFYRTRKDIKYPYGLEIGLSNGEGTDIGPSEMDEKVLLEVRDYFVKQVDQYKQSPNEEKIKWVN